MQKHPVSNSEPPTYSYYNTSTTPDKEFADPADKHCSARLETMADKTIAATVKWSSDLSVDVRVERTSGSKGSPSLWQGKHRGQVDREKKGNLTRTTAHSREPRGGWEFDWRSTPSQLRRQPHSLLKGCLKSFTTLEFTEVPTTMGELENKFEGGTISSYGLKKADTRRTSCTVHQSKENTASALVCSFLLLSLIEKITQVSSNISCISCLLSFTRIIFMRWI